MGHHKVELRELSLMVHYPVSAPVYAPLCTPGVGYDIALRSIELEGDSSEVRRRPGEDLRPRAHVFMAGRACNGWAIRDACPGYGMIRRAAKSSMGGAASPPCKMQSRHVGVNKSEAGISSTRQKRCGRAAADAMSGLTTRLQSASPGITLRSEQLQQNNTALGSSLPCPRPINTILQPYGPFGGPGVAKVRKPARGTEPQQSQGLRTARTRNPTQATRHLSLLVPATLRRPRRGL